MNFDDDVIALSLVLFTIIAFVVAAAYQGEIIELANSSIQFAIGAIAGYMSRKNKGLTPEVQAKIRRIVEENRRLKQQLDPPTKRRSPHSPEDS